MNVQGHRSHVSASLLPQSGSFYDPVWQTHITLSDLEMRLVEHPWLRRLSRISHAGASSVMSHQVYSRLEHSLGLWSLVATLRPNDKVSRVAALLHDIGHLPLSHSLERPLNLDHHVIGNDRIRRLAPLLHYHRLSADQVVEAIEGEGSSALSAVGVLKLDHLESFVRSAHFHGRTRIAPRDILSNVTLLDGGVSCDQETADYIMTLAKEEAERQTSAQNAGANAAVAQLTGLALEGDLEGSHRRFGNMTDDEFWSWLRSAPASSSLASLFLLFPERWASSPTPAGGPARGNLYFDIPRLYRDMPLINGVSRPLSRLDRAFFERLPRHYVIIPPVADNQTLYPEKGY